MKYSCRGLRFEWAAYTKSEERSPSETFSSSSSHTSNWLHTRYIWVCSLFCQFFCMVFACIFVHKFSPYKDIVVSNVYYTGILCLYQLTLHHYIRSGLSPSKTHYLMTSLHSLCTLIAMTSPSSLLHFKLHRYFQCGPKYGLFAPLPKVEKLASAGSMDSSMEG